MLYYRIADLVIEIDDLPGMEPLPAFEPFRCAPATPDLRYTIRAYAQDAPPVPPEEELTLVSEDIVYKLYLKDDMFYKRVAMRYGDARCMWAAFHVGDWHNATVWMPDTWLDYEAYGNAFSMEKALLPFGGLMLHCALIEWHGMGIAFTAPSQTGKSTQARLWHEHLGADIINGDRAILRALPEGVFAYGSPWAGSSDYFINRRVPLRLIVVIEQAPENEVSEIAPMEGLGAFLEGSSLPMFDEALLETGLGTLDTIMAQVPMARLKCRPDAGAVECVKAWLMRINSNA